MILIATLLFTANPDWQLLFRDPPRGSVYMDPASVWRRGHERAITVRFEFDRPSADGVAILTSRIEIDCRAGSFAAASATAVDRDANELYAYEFDAGRERAIASGESSRRLVREACSFNLEDPPAPAR
jgi:hypothetical protein